MENRSSTERKRDATQLSNVAYMRLECDLGQAEKLGQLPDYFLFHCH